MGNNTNNKNKASNSIIKRSFQYPIACYSRYLKTII